MPDSKVPTKEKVVKDALNYEKLEGHLAYSKGFRAGIELALPFITDYYQNKFRALIK